MKDVKVDTSDEKRQELQQKIVVYQILQKHIEELQKQVMLLQRKFLEFETAKKTLSDIGKAKAGDEIYFPLGAGIFGKGKILDKSDVMVELGAGIVAKKSAASTMDFLEEKKTEIDKSSKLFEKEMNATVEKLDEIAGELKEIVNQ